MALELNQSKHRIYEYVESRMSFIAPNLSIIVGASTAAKIMGETPRKNPRTLPRGGGAPLKPPFCPSPGIAGGLTNLSKMPACNIMLLGAQRKTLSGFSSTSVLPHTGYIYHSDIVQSLPPVGDASPPTLGCPPHPRVTPQNLSPHHPRISGGRRLASSRLNARWRREWTASTRARMER